MITNSEQLNASYRYLEKLENLLENARKYYENKNSSMFPVISKSYISEIKKTHSLISDYLINMQTVDSPLKIRISGHLLKSGKIKASVATNLLNGIQYALYNIGSKTYQDTQEIYYTLDTGKKKLLSLNLVATQPGSFIFALEMEESQGSLFEDSLISKSISNLINSVNDILISPKEYKGTIYTLRSLYKIANIIKNEIEEIEISFKTETYSLETKFNPTVKERIKYLLGGPERGEKTITGKLIEINIENNTCKVHPENENPIICEYDESLEDELILAIKKDIEMAGEFEQLSKPGKIKMTKINSFRIIDDDID